MLKPAGLAIIFQSTLPLRGATHHRDPIDDALDISIHTPLAGSDPVDQLAPV